MIIINDEHGMVLNLGHWNTSKVVIQITDKLSHARLSFSLLGYWKPKRKRKYNHQKENTHASSKPQRTLRPDA
jgi:hypothetical protein